LDYAQTYFDSKSPVVQNSAQKLLTFYMLIQSWKNQTTRAKVALKKLANSFEPSFAEATGIWLIARCLKYNNETELFSPKTLKAYRSRFPESSETFYRYFSGQSDIFIEIAAVNLMKRYQDSLLDKLITEFKKPVYDNFSPGSDKFREFLNTKINQPHPGLLRTVKIFLLSLNAKRQVNEYIRTQMVLALLLPVFLLRF
jgi:hypothetical protein